MTETISILLDLFFVYLGLGFLFALWFVTKGAKKIDAGVNNTPWHFRLMILPGSVMLWSVLLIKILRKKS